eukprot:1107424-Prymnesium_polylepis.1
MAHCASRAAVLRNVHASHTHAPAGTAATRAGSSATTTPPALTLYRPVAAFQPSTTPTHPLR